jgi:hypothetical protein
MRMRRREILSASVKLAIGSALTTSSWREARAARPSPHYVLFIHLDGGFDSTLSVDPKDSSEHGLEIDCEYGGDDRLRGERRLYGPLMGELMRHESDLCLVHGVRADTVAHPTGRLQLSRGRIATTQRDPLILEAIGRSLRGDAPLAHLAACSWIDPPPLGGGHRQSVLFPQPLVKELIERRPAAPETAPWEGIVEAEKVRQIREKFKGDPATQASLQNALAQSDVLKRLIRTGDFSEPFGNSQLELGLLVAFNTIKLNLAKSISVASEVALFDSHQDNLRHQRKFLPSTLQSIAALIDRLKSTRNAFGSLFDQTTIIIASELGRFPRLNSQAGKDHWPESSWILIGKGVRREKGGVTVGSTDERLRGAKVDFRTGGVTGDHVKPIFVDSIFATMLKIAGADPSTAGYGRADVLDCIVA